MLPHIFQRIARHPVITLLVAASCVVCAALGAARIRPTGTLEAMLSGDDPAAAALARVADAFGTTDELLVVATLPTDAPDTEVVGRTMLRRFYQRFKQGVADRPNVHSLVAGVVSGAPPAVRRFVKDEVIPNGALYLDEDAFSKLKHRLTKEGMAEQFRRNEELVMLPGAPGQAFAKTVLKDPLRLHELMFDAVDLQPGAGSGDARSELLLSEDGRSLLIRVQGLHSVSDLEYAKAVTSAIRSLADAVNEDGLGLRLSGAYAIAARSEQSIRADMIRSIVASVVMLQLLFLVVYRRVATFAIAVLPVAGGIVVAFGISSIASTELTPVVAVIGAVLAGLGIDYSIHFLSHYESDRSGGMGHHVAVETTVQTLGPAMTIACLTSMVGFLAIASSSVQALRDFAVIGALGLAASLLAVFTVLPALLGLGQGFASGRDGSVPRWGGISWRWIGGPRSGTASIVGVVVVLVVAVVVLCTRSGSHVWFESDLSVMHPRPNAPLETQREIASRFGYGTDPLLVYLHAESPDALVPLAYRVERRLNNEGLHEHGVAGVFGLPALLPDPSLSQQRRTALNKIDVDRVIADFDEVLHDSIFDPSAYQAYAAFLRRLLRPGHGPSLATLAAHPDVARTVLPLDTLTPDGALPTEALSLVMLDESHTDKRAQQGAIDAVRAALADVPQATLTGVTVIGRDTERTIRRELARLLSVAAVVVCVGLFVYYRNLGDVGLTVLPAIFGIICLVGVMHLVDLRLNMINLIGAPLLVGLGVDDGVFLVGIRRACRKAQGGADELTRGLQTACHAIVMTSLTTGLTFGSLVFTSTPAIQSLGVMMAIGILASLVGAVFLLAPLLVKVARHKSATTQHLSAPSGSPSPPPDRTA